MKKSVRSGFQRGKLPYYFFTLPSLILYSVFFALPVLLGIYYAMTNWNGVSASYDFVGIKNFLALVKNQHFWNSLKRTFLYTFLLVVFVISISLISALALNAMRHIQTLAKTIFFFPALISAVAVSLIWEQLYGRMFPQIGGILGIKALSQSPLASPDTALFGVLFVHVWQAVAMPTIIFLAGMQSIPGDLYESAVVDGAKTFQRFRYITLPYLMPTLTVNMVLALRNGITAFDYPFAMSGGSGGPVRSTELISLLIYQDGFKNTRFSMANAQAFVLFLIVVVLAFVQIALSNKKFSDQ